MRPEASPWPPIARLLASLPPEIPVGMLERKRLELVLRAVGVPREAKGFADWVQRDRTRLARIVAAVVGVAASHRASVHTAVEVWWAEECSRRAQGVRDEGWAGNAEGVGEQGAGGDGSSGGRRGWSRWVVACVGVVLALVVAWVMWGPQLRAWLRGDEERVAGNESGGEGASGGDGIDSAGSMVEDTGDDAGVESEGATDETGEPAVTAEEEPVPDLRGVYVRVPVASLAVGPGEGSVAWAPLGLALLAGVAFVSILRAKPPLPRLPAPPDHEPLPTRWGRVPPQGRPQRRILLDRGDRDALVWGIAREATDRLTEDVDVPRSVEETIDTGIPTLCFVPASEYRGVWIWRDSEIDDAHASLALRLEQELQSTLRDAGLPVQRAAFAGVPSMLSTGHRRLAAASLVGVGRPPRVVVLTDAGLLARRLHDDSTRAATEQALRLLRRWEGLGWVDFGGPRSELAVLAQTWGLQRITPDQAAAHLAGQASRVEHVAVARDLLRWEAACVLAPRSVAVDEAQRLRRALGLGASAFDIDVLCERAAAGSRVGRSRLEWSGPARAEILARFERAHGYLKEWEQRRGGASLLVRALEHWTRVYDEAIESRERDDRSDTVAHLELERAMVRLWTEPDAAARELYKWWQTDGLRDTVRELVSRHTDAEGRHTDEEGRAVRARLPWVLGSLDPDVPGLLAQMGMAVPRLEARVRPGGRRALGLGVVLGVGAAAVGVAGLEVVRTRVEVEQVGKVPQGASVECSMVEGRVQCRVASRHGVETLDAGELGGGVGLVSVQVSWALEERACEGVLGDGLRYVMCDRKGRLARQAAGWSAWSRAVLASAGGRRLAQVLLDSGTVDLVVLGEPGAGVEDVLRGPGQRLVVVDEGVGVAGVAGSGLVVEIPEGSVPDLGFAGVKKLTEAWPEAVVARGDGREFELVGVREPTCPVGMVAIAGGSFDGRVIGAYCLDTTEVTVAAYRACVDRGSCTVPDDGGSCNWGKTDRADHPINCVDWNQAKTFCEASEGRLPTGEEWEWAARGREKGWVYPWGDEPPPSCERVVMDESASMEEKRWGCDTGATWPVGSKPKGDSRDGVKDMAGNIFEWTSEKSNERYIVRGGSWSSGGPGRFRASYRLYGHVPADRLINVGFRCARTVGGTK